MKRTREEERVIHEVKRFKPEIMEYRDPFSIVFRFLTYKDWNSVLRTCKLFLDIGRKSFDPSIRDNEFIIRASYKGFTESVKWLLQDKRSDPTVCDNKCLRNACYRGHLKIVKTLLKDERIDPTIPNNDALYTACKKGHLEIVEILLQDERILKSLDINHSIEICSLYEDLEMIELFLKNKNISSLINKNTIKVIFNKMGTLVLIYVLFKYTWIIFGKQIKSLQYWNSSNHPTLTKYK